MIKEQKKIHTIQISTYNRETLSFSQGRPLKHCISYSEVVAKDQCRRQAERASRLTLSSRHKTEALTTQAPT